MILPNETWLEILRHLSRRELDCLPTVNRVVSRVISCNTHALALRIIESATINAAPDKELALKREGRAVIVAADGRSKEYDGKLSYQIVWIIKRIHHSRVNTLCIGSSTLGFVLTDELAKAITKSATTVDVGVLQFSNGYIFAQGGRFKALISSFRSLAELKISNCRGGRTIVTNGLLRLLAAKGTKLSANVEPMFLSFIRPCRVNDDAVLDYLFNPKHLVKQRYLWLYRMNASRQFLFNLILHMHAAANIDSVTFAVRKMSLRSQDLRHYAESVQRMTLDDGKQVDILDFAEEKFCARLSFNAVDGTMRHIRFTTVKEDFANIEKFG